MKKKILLLTMTLISVIPFAMALPAWQRVPQIPFSSDYISVTKHPTHRGEFVAASQYQLFEKTGTGSWKTLWQSPQSKEKVLNVSTFAQSPKSIFILTNRSLYHFDTAQKSATRLFHLHDSEDICLSFTLHPENTKHFLLGTQKTLWQSKDSGKSWNYSVNLSDFKFFTTLKFIGSSLYALTHKGLLRSQDLEHFQTVLKATRETSASVLAEEEIIQPHFFDLETSDSLCTNLWVSSNQGISISTNCGASWHHMPTTGLRHTSIKHIAYSQKAQLLTVSTEHSVYYYNKHDKQWTELHQGLIASPIRDLFVWEDKDAFVTLSPDGILFIPFPQIENRQSTESITSNTYHLLHKLIKLEPTAREIQKAVIQYANISNSKTKRWHWASRARAVIPTFSYGEDYGESNNIDLDRGSTSTPDRYISGPSDNNRGWDMSVSWDLGDLLWSSNQTSIDSREKLMIDLRHDLLSEVTRLYYERRRLQMALISQNTASDQDHFEKILRIDELSSLIDGMTNGYLEERLKNIYQNHPDLKTLWHPRFISMEIRP